MTIQQYLKLISKEIITLNKQKGATVPLIDKSPFLFMFQLTNLKNNQGTIEFQKIAIYNIKSKARYIHVIYSLTKGNSFEKIESKNHQDNSLFCPWHKKEFLKVLEDLEKSYIHLTGKTAVKEFSNIKTLFGV